MLRLLRSFTAALATALAVSTLVGSSAQAERRLALVIGNDLYQHIPALQRAGNDARAVGDALTKIGFDVTPAMDASREATLAALDAFADKLAAGDTALVFYAGQAINVGGRDHLLPIDTPKSTEANDVMAAAVTLDEIVEKLRKRSPGTVILILDTCRDNPFKATSARVRLQPGMPDDMWNGVFALYSAGLGQLALESLSSDDTDSNSLFTRVLIKSLGRPGQTLVELAADIREQVAKLAASVNKAQTPAYYDQLPARFALVPAAR
jgi:uncharacterized caspase-like protein